MEMRRRKKRFWPVAIVLLVIVGVLAFLGAQWITKTGIFKVPGVVKYDDGLSSEELELFHGIFTEETKLDADVEISAESVFTRPGKAVGEFLFNIYVPVTDYYSDDSDIQSDNAEQLFSDSKLESSSYKMIPMEELSFKDKLLTLNGSYYLDEFDKGAVFRVIKLKSDKYEEEIAPLVQERLSKNWPDKSTVLTFAQTGVTALSRGMNQKLYSVGDAGYFVEKIGAFLSSFDLTHTSNESSFSEMATANNICSDPRFIDTLTNIGLDIVELTGNHNVDCGVAAANNTVDLYKEKGIDIVGGGKNATEAAVPLQINKKGNNITFLAYNQSTGGATLGETPGANQYTEENASKEISEAKSRGDFVVVDIQYYECSAYASEYEDPTCDYANSSAGDQVGFFRHLIDLGADIVVGTSAHQPQTFELYGNGAIYYGLGNLFFDQVWWPGTTRSLVLSHYFYDGKLLQTKILPTVYDASMQTALMDEEAAKAYLHRLASVRP